MARANLIYVMGYLVYMMTSVCRGCVYILYDFKSAEKILKCFKLNVSMD